MFKVEEQHDKGTITVTLDTEKYQHVTLDVHIEGKNKDDVLNVLNSFAKGVMLREAWTFMHELSKKREG